LIDNFIFTFFFGRFLYYFFFGLLVLFDNVMGQQLTELTNPQIHRSKLKRFQININIYKIIIIIKNKQTQKKKQANQHHKQVLNYSLLFGDDDVNAYCFLANAYSLINGITFLNSGRDASLISSNNALSAVIKVNVPLFVNV